MTVDFHTHTFPDAIAARAVEKLKLAAGIEAFTDGTERGLQEAMTKGNIDYAVILPVATNPLKVRHMNQFSASANQNDAHLIHFACIHPECDDPCGTVKEAASMGLKGIKLHPVYQNVNFDDIRFLRILEAAFEHDLIVVTHSGWDVGFPGVSRITPAMVLNALHRVGCGKLVLAHMGAWRQWDEVSALAETQVMLDTSFSLGNMIPLPGVDMDLSRLSNEAFVGLVRLFGADRIVFGSDSPWSDPGLSQNEILSLPLTDAEKSAILGENACRLLGLEKK